MKKTVLAVTVIVLLLTSSSWSFDGMRKGFVLGGGLGIAPTAQWEVDGLPVDESNPGFGLNIFLGYAWDEQNMIVYEGNAVFYKSDLTDVNLQQQFNGASYYHYFGLPGKAFFINGGMGYYYFKPESYDANDIGFGMMIGAGYEFARHWQVAMYISGGKTSDILFDYNHSQISILVNAVAF